MLRKLKQQVTSAVNATVNGEPRHEELVNDSSFGNPNVVDSSNEGFLCPVCMISFANPDDLQLHFPTHSSPSSASQQSEPSHSASYFDDLDESTKLENLKSQILGEKRYSSELKKEFDRLQAVIATFTNVPEGEIPYLLQQIQALEAGKSMLTHRLLEVERDLQGAQRDKSDVITRLSELSHTVRRLRESNEEVSAAQEIASEDIQRFQGLVDILECDKKELEAQLAQRPSEDDVSVLQKELVHSQRLMDQITEQKEEEIREQLETIENLKREQADHQNIIDRLRKQVEETNSSLSGAEILRVEAEKKTEVADEQIAKLKSELDRTVSEFQSQLDSLSVVHESSKSTAEKQQKFSEDTESESQISEKDILCKDAKDEKKRLRNDLDALRKKFQELEAESSKKSQRMIEVENSIEEERAAFKKKLQTTVAKFEESQKTIIELNHSLTTERATVAKMESQMSKEKGRISSAVERLEAAEQKALQLGAELEQREKQISEQASKDLKMSSEIENALVNTDSLKNNISQKNREIEQLQSRVNELESEVVSCSEHMKSKTLHFEEQIEKSHEHNEELMTKISKSETRTVELEKTLEEKEKNIAAKTALIEDLLKRIDQLEVNVVRCEELSAEVTDSKKYLDALTERNQALQKLCDENHCSLDTSQSRCRELSEQLKVANGEKEFLLTTLHEKEKYTESQLIDRERQISDLNEKLKSREQANEILQEELNELKKFKEQNGKEIENFSRSLQQMELNLSEKCSEIDTLNMVRVGIGEELENLREQLALARSTEESYARRCTELGNELAAAGKEQNDIQNALRKEVEQLKHSFETLKESSATKLKVSEESLKTSIAERSALAEELTTKIKALSKELEEKTTDLDRLESEIELLRSNCDDMEKKLKTFGEERKGLMERCVRVESDLDFERDRAMENKKRFDDALSAMHELGRANQSLQIDMSKQFNRKWLDDSEAINCFHCGKQFSLTIRKHHCRVCGQIFCGPCSSQTAMIASYKSPVRVCFNCHAELATR